MLVFAAITPHTPLLLASQRDKHKTKLKKTIIATEELAKKFNQANVETVIIFSPHGTILPGAFAVNYCDTYEGDLKKFGDITTKMKFLPNHAFIDKIQRTLRQNKMPITLLTCAKLDYASMIPLTLLLINSNPKIIPISQGLTDVKTHFEFGEILSDLIAESPDRIGVIVSSHLSHSLSSDSPRGFSEYGKKYDELMCESLEAGKASRILNIKPELMEEADQCGFRSIVVLLGILSERRHKPKILDYNNAFGIGYLTMEFIV